MQQSSLVKWVDELQGQIDELKRTGGNDAALAARIAALETGVSALVTGVAALENRPIIQTGIASDVVVGARTVTIGVEGVTFDIPCIADPTDYDIMVYADYKHATSESAWIAAMTGEFTPCVVYDMTVTAADPAITGAVHLSHTVDTTDNVIDVELERGLDDGSIGLPESGGTGVTINYMVIYTKKPTPPESKSGKNRRK